MRIKILSTLKLRNQFKQKIDERTFYQIYEYHYKNGKVKLRMTKSQM